MSNVYQKAIAIDFDGTLCTNKWPQIGKPKWRIIKRALRKRKHGYALILWTCREGVMLEQALAKCGEWGLCFDAVNESLPTWVSRFGNDCRKIGADEYWDDKARRII